MLCWCLQSWHLIILRCVLNLVSVYFWWLKGLIGVIVFFGYLYSHILLLLHEIIKEEDQNMCMTLLEYLKQHHTMKQKNFVKNTKILTKKLNIFGSFMLFGSSHEKRLNNLSFYCIRFKSLALEFILCIRTWVLLYTQIYNYTL